MSIRGHFSLVLFLDSAFPGVSHALSAVENFSGGIPTRSAGKNPPGSILLGKSGMKMNPREYMQFVLGFGDNSFSSTVFPERQEQKTFFHKPGGGDIPGGGEAW